jgi:hypothetical protein
MLPDHAEAPSPFAMRAKGRSCLEDLRRKPQEEWNGQSHDVPEVAVDPLDERRTTALDRVRARPIWPFPALDVPPPEGLVELPERDQGPLHAASLLPSIQQYQRTEDDVRPPRQAPEESVRLVLVACLAEQLAVEQNLRVGAEHEAVGRCGPRLAARILEHRLFGIALRALFNFLRPLLERDSELLEDRPPLGRGRCKDEPPLREIYLRSDGN